jgi:hypothetical protein
MKEEQEVRDRIAWNLERIANGEEPLKVFPPAYFSAIELGILDEIPEDYRPTEEDFPESFQRYAEWKENQTDF